MNASRIAVSGRIRDADSLRWLVRAVVHDARERGDPALPDDVAAALDAIGEAGDGPLRLAAWDAAPFEALRGVCRQLGLSYVHEVEGADGPSWTCFDERARPSLPPLFGFRGTVEAPLVPFDVLDDPGATDDEMGAVVRRQVAGRIGAARRIAEAALDVEASLLDELRNSMVPARGRGLL